MSGVKAIARVYGGVRALPHRLRFAIAKAMLGPERAFSSASERISRIPGLTGVYTRFAFYRAVLPAVGEDAYIGYMTVFSKQDATLGEKAYIGRFCSIGYAEIGEKVMLADGVQVLSGRHTHGSSADAGKATGDQAQNNAESLHDKELQISKVTIGKGAWVGANAVVMADVGEHAIVGAGAVVTKPVPAGTTVGGVPAKQLGAGKNPPQGPEAPKSDLTPAPVAVDSPQDQAAIAAES